MRDWKFCSGATLSRRGRRVVLLGKGKRNLGGEIVLEFGGWHRWDEQLWSYGRHINISRCNDSEIDVSCLLITRIKVLVY